MGTPSNWVIFLRLIMTILTCVVVVLFRISFGVMPSVLVGIGLILFMFLLWWVVESVIPKLRMRKFRMRKQKEAR